MAASIVGQQGRKVLCSHGWAEVEEEERGQRLLLGAEGRKSVTGHQHHWYVWACGGTGTQGAGCVGCGASRARCFFPPHIHALDEL